MEILLERAESEIIVKKSRFISIALPCSSLEEIKSLVKQIRDEHPNATHVVHAAVIGPKGDLYSMSDDREPKNTAGRPALEVLKGSGVTNILVCIVRYFGGTLLGTGGLVKAYGDSTKEVLGVIKTEPLIAKVSFSMMISYDFYELIKRLLIQVKASNVEEEFTSGITIKGMIPLTEKETLSSKFVSITMGRCTITFS